MCWRRTSSGNDPEEMNETKFYPPRRKGVLLHSLAILILTALGVFFIIQAFLQPAGGLLALFLIIGFLVLIPVLGLVYRLYALTHSSYELERDGLRIRWGLRVEEMPLNEIEWVRPADELGEELSLPFLSTPGALLGSVISPNLGVIEFLASERNNLVVVATDARIIAISPDDPAGFSRAFQRAAEMGSLSPLEPVSTQPAVFVIRVWRDKTARLILLLMVGLTLGLLVLDSLLALSRASISLGYSAAGSLLEPVAASNLLLLPVLALFGTVSDMIAGLFLYQREQYRAAAYILWCAGGISALLLVAASLILAFSS